MVVSLMSEVQDGLFCLVGIVFSEHRKGPEFNSQLCLVIFWTFNWLSCTRSVWHEHHKQNKAYLAQSLH